MNYQSSICTTLIYSWLISSSIRIIQKKIALLFINVLSLEKEKKKQITCKDSLPVPLLVIHAIDDPIIHADTLPCHSGVAETVDNIAVLVTNQGGHVGWPLGLNPSKNRWLLQNNLILEFIAAAASE